MNLDNIHDSPGWKWARLVVQTVLIICLIVSANSAEFLWPAVVSMSLSGAAVVGLQVLLLVPRTRAKLPDWVETRGFRLLLVSSLLLTTLLLDQALGEAAALVCAAVVMASHWKGSAQKSHWKLLVFIWLGFLSLLCLMTGYIANDPGGFFGGLLSVLALLVLCRLSFLMKPAGVRTVNTVILLLAGLPVADRAYRFRDESGIRPETYSNYCSYEKARGNPSALREAQDYFKHQLTLMARAVFEPIPPAGPSNHQNPGRNFPDNFTDQPAGFRPRPNSHGCLMQCRVSINSKGFRGKEISMDKDVYRIIALGESTTFGMTFAPDDKPWPELLEQIIHERMKTRRPVEVINAGVVAYTLLDNLRRLPDQILPLKPAMIISYHGANGFYMIDDDLNRPLGDPPPAYEERPFKLLGDLEQRIRMLLFVEREKPKALSDNPALADPMRTRYADAYRQLIRTTMTNGVRLMLANYSMAANDRSDPAVIAFYYAQAGSTGGVRKWVRANQIHSQIVRQLVRDHPEVRWIDTHPHLDGEHEKFIDIMHFTQDGRRQMAENMFEGIRKTLEKDIGQ